MYKALPPFRTATPHDSYYQMLNERNALFWRSHQQGESPDFFNDDFKQLITWMLQENPEQRPTLD